MKSNIKKRFEKHTERIYKCGLEDGVELENAGTSEDPSDLIRNTVDEMIAILSKEIDKAVKEERERIKGELPKYNEFDSRYGAIKQVVKILKPKQDK